MTPLDNIGSNAYHGEATLMSDLMQVECVWRS
jgi:hypothetical protein